MILQKDFTNIGIFPPFTVKQTTQSKAVAGVQSLALHKNVNHFCAGQGDWGSDGENAKVLSYFISIVCSNSVSLFFCNKMFESRTTELYEKVNMFVKNTNTLYLFIKQIQGLLKSHNVAE